MKARLTYLPKDIAEQFDDFIINRESEEILETVKARTKEYSTLSLLKLLYQLRTGPKTFTELYRISNIRMKKSFLSYLHLCIDYNFVQREEIDTSIEYTITNRGSLMLNLFLNKEIGQ